MGVKRLGRSAKFGVYEQELLTNGVSVVCIGTLILTDRGWVHVLISVLYFLAVTWTTARAILEF